MTTIPNTPSGLCRQNKGSGNDWLSVDERWKRSLMATIFETERLIARQWVPQEDAFQAFEMYGDPVITRFIGSQVESNIEQSQQLLSK